MLISLRPVKKLIRSWLSPRQRKTIRRQPSGVRPWLESLEDRLAPTAGLTAGNQQLLQSYGQLPISFEVNAGQTDARVRYLAHGSGYALFLTSTGAVLNLETPTAPPSKGQLGSSSFSVLGSSFSAANSAPPSVTGVALAMNLVGANPGASVAGQDQLPGTTNYFIGNDPSQWHTNIANYGQVAYQGVYPGVNLVYYGNQQQLEYDFVVAPSADPTRIQFAIQGADSISLDGQGNLVLATGSGDVLEHAPVVYQEVSGARQAVAGQFVLLGQDEVGFQVGTCDPSLPLTIDPVLSYSTYLGGSGTDEGTGIAVDGSGNAYVTGDTTSTNFPTTAGAYHTSFGGGSYPGDAFVTKLNASGTALIYSTYLGGSGGDGGRGIAVDGSGNAYVTGNTASTDFPTTAGAFQTSLAGTQNAFVTKLNASGTALVYSTYLGGSGGGGVGDYGSGIAVDSSDNAYVTGLTSSTDFPTTAGAFQSSSRSTQSAGLGQNTNAFVTKLKADGTALIYSTYLGGNGDRGVAGIAGGDVASAIAVDVSGNAYVSGLTNSSDFPTTPGAYQTSLRGVYNAFVTKLNADGTALIYSTYLGGSGVPNFGDYGHGIAVDGSGNAYVTGSTFSSNFPTTPGAFRRSLAGTENAFVTKLNADGTALIYSTYLGGNGINGAGFGDAGSGIAVDGSGNAYITGSTPSSFPTTAGAFQTIYGGNGHAFDNAFVTILNATGTTLIYSTYLGGSGYDTGAGIAVDGSGNAYVTGQTDSSNFPTTAGAYQTSYAGTNDSGATDIIRTSFVAKFTFVLPATHFQVTAPATANSGVPVRVTVTALDQNNNPTGSGYTGTVHFTSTDGSASLPSDTTLTGGTGTFSATFKTAGTWTTTATDTVTSSITGSSGNVAVSAGPFGQFVVSIPGSNTLVAGNPFLFTAQAADSFGNPVTSYSGPTNITATATPADPQSNVPITGTLNSSGFGFFLGNLKTAGSYTLTTTAGTVSGTSVSLTVTPSDANYFTVTAPAAATTGSPFNVTVTAFDHFGNIATGYNGTVAITSGGNPLLPFNPILINGVGTFHVTLKTGGTWTVTATDTSSTNPAITGSSSPITTRGLTVTAFTPTATGFTVAFSKPIVAADVFLYGGTVASPIQNVTLVGTSSGPVTGTFVIDPSGSSASFKASSTYLQTFFQESVLPNDTWKATLASGTGTGATANGFFDALGAPLDGANNAGHGNYTTTFTTTNDGNLALSIPDFARGPDGSSTIKVPNDSAKGIPVTLSNVPAASGVTDVAFTLSYNPTLFTPTAGATSDSSGTGSNFVMGTPASVDATHATVTFTWHNSTAQSGTVVLGDILANVPNSAANQYKGKEILGLGSITVNGAAFTGVAAGGLHVNAYLGDVTGDGQISGLDVATAGAVAAGNATSPIGLAAFRLVDPAIVGDIAGDASIDATAVSDLASFTSNLHPPQIPAPPTGLTITPGGPDPTLSLGEPSGGVGRISNPSYSGIISVPVLLDHPHPDGSTGMNEAILALTYNPSVLSVSPSDITLGSIPSLGKGWQLKSVVDQATGQIGIDLYSMTPITAAQAGSLVNIAFHVVPGVSVPATAVLVNSVAPGGHWFSTEVADGQGQFVLSPGMDRLEVETGVSRWRWLPGRRYGRLQ